MRYFPSLLLVAACSASPTQGPDTTPTDSGTPADDDAQADSASPDDGGQPIGDETWMDGKTLTASVVIPAGVTVTIAPGAKITCSAGVSITVKGTLTASSATPTHALLTGTSWAGIIASGKGQVLLDGVDLTGASPGIDDKSSAPAKYDNGTIKYAGHPFLVELGATLSTSHATVTLPSNDTQVEGAFTASYLDYDANGGYAIYADDPAANVFIEDSKFHGSTPGDPDLLNAYGATRFHVAYSDITGAHCGFHFAAVDTMEVDHVTVHGVTNGADLWGSSSTGTRTITSSNFDQLAVGFDSHGSNGPISVTNCYEGAGNNLPAMTAVTINSPASAPIAGAGPR